MAQFFVYFGEKYCNASGGLMGMIVNESTMQPATWEEAAQLLEGGEQVTFRKATAEELKAADLVLQDLRGKLN